MKTYLLLILISFLLMPVLMIQGAEDNSTETTDDGDGQKGNLFEDDDDNSTSSDNKTGPVKMDSLDTDAECKTVYKQCTDQDNFDYICVKLDDTMDCLNENYTDESNNNVYSCGEEDLSKMDVYCFGTALLKIAKEDDVSDNCQNCIKSIVNDKGKSVEDYSHTCQFVEKYANDLKAADTGNATFKCTEDEYTKFRESTCFACRGTMASLLLVLVMVAAQKMLTWA